MLHGKSIHVLQELPPAFIRLSSLGHDRFTQRMMAVDEEIVAPVEALQIMDGRNPGHFPLAIAAAIAERAGQDQVPDAIEIDWCVGLQDMGKEMVHVTGVFALTRGIDVGKAVKAFALLVAVECRTDRCDVLAFDATFIDGQKTG